MYILTDGMTLTLQYNEGHDTYIAMKNAYPAWC